MAERDYKITQNCGPIFFLQLFCSIHAMYTYIHTFLQRGYKNLTLLFHASLCVTFVRGVFITQSNIRDGAYCLKASTNFPK